MVHGGRLVFGRQTRWGGVPVGLLLVVLTAPASAHPNEPPAERELITIDYDADPSCPTYEELLANVREYTPRWALAADGDDARHFRLTLHARDGRVVGTLAIEDAQSAEHASASRTITGPDCATVARGMAIAVAVAVDPSALSPRGSSAPEPPEEPPPAAPPEAPPAPRPEPRRPPPRRSEAESQGTRFSVDARVELTSAVVVGFLPVASAALELEPFRGARAMHLPRWLRPSLAVGVRQSLSRSIERSTVTTAFVWTAGVVRLCPARFAGAGERFELTPCIESDLGVLHATATGSSDARSATNRWIDVGASARATWSIGGGWFLGGAASTVVPISRNRFELSTRTLVSQAPRVGVTFGLSGGLRF